MPINELISVDRIICNVEVSSKKRALEVISELFGRSLKQMPTHKIFESLINRERLGSTGLGNGVAIPHTRMEEIEQACGVMVKLKEGIDFGAIDNQPVDIMFSLLVPEHYTDEHLQILAELAEMFSDTEMCSSIRECESAEPVYQILCDWAVKNDSDED